MYKYWGNSELQKISYRLLPKFLADGARKTLIELQQTLPFPEGAVLKPNQKITMAGWIRGNIFHAQWEANSVLKPKIAEVMLCRRHKASTGKETDLYVILITTRDGSIVIHDVMVEYPGLAI